MIKFFKKVISNFIGEYITNKIVANFPSHNLRSIFYRKVLKIEMEKSAFIQMGCYIYKSHSDLYIGSNTIINRNSVLDRRGNLYIGSNVNISAEVAIYTAGHNPYANDFADYVKTVRIEDYVWLGTRAMVMPGVTIKKGAVVLPGAIVTHDVEEYAIVGGVPAKICGMRPKELNYELNWRPYFT